MIYPKIGTISDMDGIKITGEYFYLYKTFLIKMNINEAFEMNKITEE